VQRLELLQHVGDAAADHVALLAQGGELGAGALRIRDPALQRLDLSREEFDRLDPYTR